jgi:hypothetical protein
MKLKSYLSILLLCAVCVSGIRAQGFKAPSDGKAVIYFVRDSKMSFGATFEYFVENTFVGEFKGVNYMRCEIDPGEYLIWVKAENIDYMPSKVEAGSTYIVMVEVYFGGHLGLKPVKPDDAENLNRARTLVNAIAPITTPEKVFEKKKDKHAKLIPEKIKLYHEKYKLDPERHFSELTPDLAIHEDLLK